jgi:hypothetical protein
LGPFLDQICIAVGRVVKKAHRPNAKHTAAELAVRERLILFCAASGTDWIHAGIPAEAVTHMVVKGLIERDAVGTLSLTDRGSRPRRVASDAARPVKLEAAAKISFGYCCTDQGERPLRRKPLVRCVNRWPAFRLPPELTATAKYLVRNPSQLKTTDA